MPPNMLIRRHRCADSQDLDAGLRRPDTAACCSSALAASLADSLSMSTELPSACVAPTDASAWVVNAGALDARSVVDGAQRGGEGAVEVHVDAAVAGRRGVGDVGGQRFMTLCSA